MADTRIHGTVKEKVAERFEQEWPHLAPLPPARFSTCYRERRRVALDAFIDVKGNHYSVPVHLCGETVAVHIGLDGHLKVFNASGSGGRAPIEAG